MKAFVVDKYNEKGILRLAEMPEPSFEPGETTLQMRLVGKVKFR